jgi:coproporphyrinogen III oxidase
MTQTKENGTLREEWVGYIRGLQQDISEALERLDGEARFQTDNWQRTEGGGGRTRVIQQGAVFEKGGVNTSVVHGAVTPAMQSQLDIRGTRWFAAGLSLVIHPLNPFVPTVHANWRYFELYDAGGDISDRWFGGGADLTPYYLFEEDARHFHGTLQHAMTPFGGELYPLYKKQCDAYFNNAHRGTETRGIGGVFYDHLRERPGMDAARLLDFQRAGGDCFLEAYLPIVERRRRTPFTAEQKKWQEIRRGRYVEFNLIHDRGTLFGLKTGGRTESILMSLPPTARFVYDYEPPEGTPERELLEVCRHPREWV